MMLQFIQAGTCRCLYVESSMIQALVPLSGHEYEMYLKGGRCVRVRMFQREHNMVTDAFRREDNDNE